MTAYLQDAPSTSAPQEWTRWHARHVEAHADYHAWGLIDGAIVGPACLQALAHHYGTPLPVFAGTPMDDYDDMGLFLWPLSAFEMDKGAWLLEQIGARPAFGIIGSRHAGSDVAQTVAWLAAAHASDGLRLYMRVGDSHTLAAALPLLSGGQVRRMREAIDEWLVLDRDGQLMNLPIPIPEHDTPAARGPFMLDDAQYAALLAANLPDQVHAEIAHHAPHLIDGARGSRLHAWLAEQIKQANGLGIEHPLDLVQYAQLALQVGGPFDDLPQLKDTWAATRTGRRLGTQMVKDWTDAQWDAIDRRRLDLLATTTPSDRLNAWLGMPTREPTDEDPEAEPPTTTPPPPLPTAPPEAHTTGEREAKAWYARLLAGRKSKP